MDFAAQNEIIPMDQRIDKRFENASYQKLLSVRSFEARMDFGNDVTRSLSRRLVTPEIQQSEFLSLESKPHISKKRLLDEE